MTVHRYPDPHDAAADRARWHALYVLCAAMLMIVLDVTVVNVALPSIQDELGFSQPGLAWVVNAYLIAFGGLLLLAGRLGDLLSRRDVFLAGLAVFTAASVGCGVAGSQEMLVAARFLQGVGGAMASAVVLGVIVTLFPEPREQARAMGVYGFVASAGGSIGLLVGGSLTEAIGWHWVFFVNVPIGLVVGAMALRMLERDRGTGLGQGADVLGAVLVTAALMLLVYTIVEPAANDGWGAGRTLALGAVALGLLGAFVARQARARNPLIPLRVVRSRTVALANTVQLLCVPAMFGSFFLGALYLERVLGYEPLEIGMAFLPTTLVMGTCSLRYAGALVARFGPRTTLLAGLALVAAGLAALSGAPVDGAYLADLLPALLLLGAGAGISFPALMTLAMSGATPQDAGLASGLINTTGQVGGALGLAVMATVAQARGEELLRAGSGIAGALTGGFRLAYLLGVVLVLGAIAIALALPRSRRDLEPARVEAAYSEAA